MNRFLGIVLFLTFSLSLFGRDISGVVDSDGKGLKNVVVTDGFNFTQTNENGVFKLNVSTESEFVYIFIPSGYRAVAKEGISQFFKRIDQQSDNLHFELNKIPDCNKYVLIAVGDPQTKTLEQYNIFEQTVISDLKSTIDGYIKKNVIPVTVYLGDVVWDNMKLFDNHKQGISKLGTPVYSAIGNHDYQKELIGDTNCGKAFGNCFGPAYYGFVLGKNYVIVLDNIIYNTNKQYIEDVSQSQIEWLKGYLKFVPKDAEIFIVMHAPVNKPWIDNYKLSLGHQQIMNILSGYKLSFITGHTHINNNLDIIPGVMEHNVASSCGAFWKSFYCMDGTPSGYQIFEFNENECSWYFKTIGKDRSYQMELYKPGSFSNMSDAVVAKVWNWDPLWKVEWFGNGKYMGEMKQFKSTDPKYISDMEKLIEKGKLTRQEFEKANYLKPRLSQFFFAAFPLKGVREIKVVVSDRFGNIYNDIILN